MSTEALLVAGPCHLDTIAEQTDLIGGAAAYAAIAAAALIPCQLWSRCGADFPAQCRHILEKRRIDIAGCIPSGDCNRFNGTTLQRHGSTLPEESPVDAQLLAACLSLDLPIDEARRAWKDYTQLSGHKQRLQVATPSHHCTDTACLQEWATHTDILIMNLEQAQALTKQQEALDVATTIQTYGCTTVILLHGNLGGILAYKNMYSGFLAIPRQAKEPTGHLSSFSGVLTAAVAKHGKVDFRGLKRACATASAVAGTCQQGIGPKKLLELGREDYLQLYNKLRRSSKF